MCHQNVILIAGDEVVQISIAKCKTVVTPRN